MTDVTRRTRQGVRGGGEGSRLFGAPTRVGSSSPNCTASCSRRTSNGSLLPAAGHAMRTESCASAPPTPTC